MNELDEILLLKYLQNNCSEEELAIVNSWKNLSKDNRNRLLEMERIWHSGDKIRFAKESHILRAEKLLYSRIKDIEEKKQNISKSKWLYSTIKYAAAIIILFIGTYFAINYFRFNVTDYEIVTTSKTDPVRQIILPDGTKVWLNHSSILKYPKKFTEKKRVVELEGEAYFEVTKDTKRPFSVQNETLDVQVLGTVFNMNCDKNRQLAEVSLIRGSVKVTGKHDEGMIVLSSGQKAELNKSTKQMHVRTFNTQLDAVWHDGMIPFEDATISEIVSTLQHLYKTEIILSPDIDKSTYSGVLYQKENLDSVLLNLTLAMPIEYTKNEGKIYIKPIKR